MATTITLSAIDGNLSVLSGHVVYIFLDVDINGSPAPNGTTLGITYTGGSGGIQNLTTQGGFAFYALGVGVGSPTGSSSRTFQAHETNTSGPTNGAPLTVTWYGASHALAPPAPNYAPTAPVLSGEPGNIKAILHWTAPSIPHNPSPVTQPHVFIRSYRLFWSTTPGFSVSDPESTSTPFLTDVTPPGAAFVQSGLTNGTTYYFRVGAMQNIVSIGDATWALSNQVTVTPRPVKEFWGKLART